jgi:glycosyltransferase involved in cell wall biosynthesis
MINKQYNILFIPGGYHPLNSGPGNFISWTASGLAKNGQKVTIVSQQNKGGVTQGISAKRMDVDGIILQYVRSFWWQFHIPFFYRCYREMNRNDIIHLNSIFHPMCILVGIYATIMGKRNVIWSVHGGLFKYALRKSSKKKKIFLKIIKTFRPPFTFHVSSEDEFKSASVVLKDSKFVIVPTCIRVPKSISNKKENYHYILFMGRLHPIRGIELLFDALSKTDDFLLSSYKLKVAGTGDDSYSNELRIESQRLGLNGKVEFCAQVDGIHKSTLIEEALALILPSYSEGFGNVVLESLSAGTPVIASHGMPWEGLNQYKAGCWVEHASVAISKAISNLIKMSRDEHFTLRQNASRLAQEKFSIDICAKAWLNVPGFN